MPDEETTVEKTDLEMVTDEIAETFEEVIAEENAAREVAVQKDVVEENNAAQKTVNQKTANQGDESTASEQETTQAESSIEEEQATGKEKETNKETLGGDASSSSDLARGTPSISNDLLLRAAGVGISLADARTFSSDFALEQFLAPIEAEQAFTEANAEEAPADPLADLPKLDPDVHDAAAIERDTRLMDVIKQERETNQAMAERLEAVEDQQRETSRVSEEAIAVERNQWFDERISGLGKHFAKALGDGKTTSLQQESSQWANRERIANLTSVLISGYEAEGLKSPPLDELFQTAAQTVLQNEFQQLHEEKLSGKLGSRATQHIERAGGRKAAASQTPEEFAVAELEKLGIPA